MEITSPNRRVFLQGILATTAIVLTPAAITNIVETSVIDWQAFMAQWWKDAAKVLSDVISDQIIYGVGGYQQIDTYPYIERIDPTTLYKPNRVGGLFD